MDLFPHNESAYRAAAAMLNQDHRACVIHPTGTGKSYIAFQLIEDCPAAAFLWLAPNDYIFKSQCRSLKKDFISPSERVTFMTYAKLMQLSETELSELMPDYIILDEFHRCGAYWWGLGVQKLLDAYPDAKILGLSATPIRYLDNCRNMAEELFTVGGKLCIASEMTLGEAIVRGILPAPHYVTTMFRYQDELRRYQNRINTLVPKGMQQHSQQYLDALRRALHAADGLDGVFARHITDPNGKYILFCANWEHLQQIKEKARAWFSYLDSQPHFYTLYSGDTNTDAEYENFLADKSGHLKLLFCINRLNEGIHVEDISGVILFRPTASPILYKQQIGRALTSGRSSNPLILDVVNNFDSLLSIGTIRSEMADAVRRLRSEGKDHLIVAERFEVLEQVENAAQLVRDLENTLNNTWDMWYGEACSYYLAHGDLKVPKRYVTENGMQLGIWLQTQRAVYSGSSRGELNAERIAALNAIGMIWGSLLDSSWEDAWKIAAEYHQIHGNLSVPDHFTIADFDLGNWISYQRKRKKNGKLEPDRVKKLESIGMLWDVQDAQWELHFLQAEAYYREHGNLNIPSSFRTEDGFLLGLWVANQKKAKVGQPGKRQLTLDQIARLSGIGMCWEKKQDTQWLQAYAIAEQYFVLHGNTNVPYLYCTDTGFRLGKWLARQRSCTHSSERAEKLRQIGIGVNAD